MPINWNRRRYTKEQFINAWNSSDSIAEVARRLNLTIYGSTYTTLKDTAEELSLSRNHMTGQGHLKGKSNPWALKRKNEEVFVLGRKENNGILKNRLINDFGWKTLCHSCENFEWMGEPIPLELEHINGNNKDNRIENLKFLCPNCHALTPTWRGRNIKGRLDKLEKSASSKVASKEGNLDAGSNPAPPTCPECGVMIRKRSKMCQQCYKKSIEKINWPSTEELLHMLSERSCLSISKELGVSDKAIMKRIKNHPV